MLLDNDRLHDVIKAYKADFVSNQWPEERYKWVAVKNFQDNWDIGVADFAAMLKQALAGTDNLLVSAGRFPGKMIVEFAQVAPSQTRQMFNELFNEDLDIWQRIKSFKENAQPLLVVHGQNAKNHYQDENAIFTYLWLRYPEKYYIYKISEIKEVAKELHSDLVFKNGQYEDNVRNFLSLYNAIRQELSKDNELKELLRSQLAEDCYPDEEMCTMTADIGYYISRRYKEPVIWKISHGPGVISEEEYDIFAKKQIAVVHGDTGAKGKEKETQGEKFINKIKKGDFFYLCRGNSIRLLGQFDSDEATINPEKSHDWYQRSYRVIATSQDESRFSGKSKWWTPNNNSTCHKIDDNKEFETTILKPYFGLTLKEMVDNNQNKSTNYWWLNANPKIWSFSSMAVGETQNYTLYNDKQHKRRIFQNFLDAQVGDMVIGYESTPIKQIVALCQISKAQDGERIYFKKIEHLSAPIDLTALQDCPELADMEFFKNSQASLLKLSADEYNFILDLVREENPLRDKKYQPYSEQDFLSEVFISKEKYDSLVQILKAKKNIILQGAPGVGKTFTAKRLAYSVMGEKDESRIEFVQFHQNYSYEDFVMGYKPEGNGFRLKSGIFYQFCQKAASEPEKDYFFIIDEINRGNMSKIFGELLMLIEKGYREKSLTLAYNGLPFSIPSKLHIIGMMNTADRSLAMIDYALRRRFSFFDMVPEFDSSGFQHYQKSLNNEKFNQLVDTIKDLNRDIAKDKSLGKGFCIGHSYLCGAESCSDEWLQSVVKYDILPMLAEYWFDEPGTYEGWAQRLTDAVK